MSEPAPPLDPPRSYQAVAGVYDAVASCWSRGRIDRAKRWQSEAISSGRDWLFAGVGTGLEALLAARGGARVTALDLAPAMLAATRRRLAAEGLDAELICGDLFEHECADGYDVVVANFVLNVMGPDTMRRALHRLAELTRPAGTLSIADFAPARGGWLVRAIALANWAPVLLGGRLLGLASPHPLHDYEPALSALDLATEQRCGFALWRGGPELYEVLIARRPD